MKALLFWLGIVITTTAGIRIVQQKKHILANSRSVLLTLQPRDPRSLMQGDYMVLRYELAQSAPGDQLQRRGKLVLKLDANNIGTFQRLHDASALAADEQLIDYRNYNGIEIGAESFFFQEGTGQTFKRAKYAELKISPDGEYLLTALCDEKRLVLKAEVTTPND